MILGARMIRSPRLTENQRRVYDFIAYHIREKGYAPTHREIAEACGYNSVHSASRHVESLIRKKVIERVEGIARGLVLRRDAWPATMKTSAGDTIVLLWARRD